MLLRHSQSGGLYFVVVVVSSNSGGAFRSGARGCCVAIFFCNLFSKKVGGVGERK